MVWTMPNATGTSRKSRFSVTERRLPVVIALSLAVLLALAAPSRRRVVAPPADLRLDMRRSFVVTDKAILDGFSFDRVLQALIDRGGVSGLTAPQLYRQWF